MATEEIANQIEDVGEQIEEVAEITRNITSRQIGFFVTGAVVGVAVGCLVSSRYFKTKYEKLVDEEVEQMRQHYHDKVVALQDKPKAEELVEELGYTPTASQENTTRTDYRRPDEAQQQEEVPAYDKTTPEKEPEVENVFVAATGEKFDEWDYDKELRGRTPDKPYVIHVDEFNENETNYEQVTYTYWESNDILSIASTDEIIEEVDRIVGLDNLKLFGHGSTQTHAVYVRNDKLNMDIEILRSESDYAEVVHGVDLTHSEEDHRMRRKHRFDDEPDTRD